MGDISTLTWSTTPTDKATTLENHQIRIAMLQRLLEPIIRTNNTERPCEQCDITCPKCNQTYKHQDSSTMEVGDKNEIDVFGAHTIRCGVGGWLNRTRIWHDPLRDVWLSLFRMAGFTAVKEPTNMMRENGQRPDVSVTMEESFQYLHLDIRTCDPLLKKHVKNCSQQMGYAATSGANDKDDKWIGHTLAQGDIFQAICHEHPGRMGEGAMAALDRAAARFAPTVPQRNAFKTYWLQRLHMTNTRGVAELIFQQMPFCKGDDALPPFAVPDPFPATMDMAHPNPRPVSFPLTNDQPTNLPNTQTQNNAINRNRVEGTN